MQDNIPDALIAAFERHYDFPWNEPTLRNERLAWRAAWAEATKPCLLQITEPQAAPAAVAVLDVLREAEAALEVAIARILKADPGHSISVTSEAKALVAVRAALAATPAAIGNPISKQNQQVAEPMVLPEPVATIYTMEALAPGGAVKYHARVHKALPSGTKLLAEPDVRALLAQADTGLPVQAVEPSDAELIALNAGECFFSESPSKYPEAGHGTQYHAGAPGVIAFGRAAIALRAYPAARSQKFQQRVQPWMMACFGPEISADRMERNHRFLEEALELVQCLGCTASEAHQLVDYVYGRTWGDPAQEAGGVMVTLAALCQASSLDMHACGETELARIWTKVEAIRAKQAAKPKHSPLPMHVTEAQEDARDAQWLQPDDMAALERFAETTDDDQSYDIGKEAVKRLARFGCVESKGFGCYSITAFGSYVLGDRERARELPFKTQADRDAESRAAIAAAKGE